MRGALEERVEQPRCKLAAPVRRGNEQSGQERVVGRELFRGATADDRSVQFGQQEQISRAIETRGDCGIQEVGWPALFIEDLTTEGKQPPRRRVQSVMVIDCSSPSSITVRHSHLC